MSTWTAPIKHVNAIITNFVLSPRAGLRNIFRYKSIPHDEEIDSCAYTNWVNTRQFSLKQTEPSKVFLVVSFFPLPYCLKMEGLIARAMQAKGYRIVVLTNQACLPWVAAYHAEPSGFKIIVLEDYLSPRGLFGLHSRLKRLLATPATVINKVKAFQYRGANIGQHALATVSSQVNDGRIRVTVDLLRQLYRTLRRSVLLTDAAIQVVEEVKPSKVFALEKGFVGTCEIFYAALDAGVDYVQWCGCHEPNSIMLKRYNKCNFREHPFSISNIGWQRILETPPLNEDFRQRVIAQFAKGYLEGDWFKYKNLVTDLQQQKKQDLLKQLNLNPLKKTAVIYSHILNDANLFYGTDLFEGGYEEWLVETVKAAASNDAVNWVLKLHPANVSRNAKSGYTGEFGELVALKQAFGTIPAFLRIVYPDDKTSPFSYFKITDYGVTVRGTVGLELPCFGIPTLTAGTGRYSSKGFTVDSVSSDEYLTKIKNIHLIEPLTDQQVELGQRYAYFVFQARPARYGAMFSDVYKFPISHVRHRDIEFGDKDIATVLKHPQMQLIVNFLCSETEDYLDPSHAKI